jgi:predicted nuclease with TOPRIM domain
MWTSKEKDAVWKKWCDDVHLDDIVRAERLATLAVELVQARGGTMTEDALTTLYADMARWWEQEDVDRIAGHIIAQGAQVATLQAKVEGLEREAGDARAERDAAREDVTALRAKMERLKADAALVDKMRRADLAVTKEYAARWKVAEARLAAIREQETARAVAAVTSLAEDVVYSRVSASALNAGQACAWLSRETCKRLGWNKSTDEAKALLEGAARRVAAERDALRAEVERLKAALEDTKDRLRIAATDSEMAEARLAAIEERANDTQAILDRALDGILGVVAWVCNGAPKEYDGPGPEDMLEGDATQGAKDLVEVVTITSGMVGKAQKTEVLSVRYPCAPTCTHDDARTPGHPERVRQRSEAVEAALAPSYSHGDSLHTDVPPGSPVVESGEEQEARGYDDGAEAMRAACWEAVQEYLDVSGLATSAPAMRDALKAAIEGAAP